eukprot:scaffold2603_cov168-Skeletonema_marinoi.AAC.1
MKYFCSYKLKQDKIWYVFLLLPYVENVSYVKTRGSVEKGELKPGGARAVPEDACGACWVRVGRRRWMANALVQARPNCWRKRILGYVYSHYVHSEVERAKNLRQRHASKLERSMQHGAHFMHA